MATRYSEIVREHAYLIGLMNLAVRTGDANLLTQTEKRLVETELECNECSSTLRSMRQELLSPAPRDVSDGYVVAADQTWEYADSAV
jgi:hypothetical protein